jgi:hypothetical protein
MAPSSKKTASYRKRVKDINKRLKERASADLTVFLYQRDRDYCIGMISSRWWAKGANVCGAGGL